MIKRGVYRNTRIYVCSHSIQVLQGRYVLPTLTDIERKSDTFVWNFSPYWGQATYLEKGISSFSLENEQYSTPEGERCTSKSKNKQFLKLSVNTQDT